MAVLPSKTRWLEAPRLVEAVRVWVGRSAMVSISEQFNQEYSMVGRGHNGSGQTRAVDGGVLYSMRGCGVGAAGQLLGGSAAS